MSVEENLRGYRIDDISIDLEQRRVCRGDTVLELGKLTYELLVLLAEEAPAVVTHDILLARLWGRKVVSKNTEKQRIRLLRQALSDDAEAPKYVDVIRGHGYRLIPEVHRVIRQDSQDSAAAPAKLRRSETSVRRLIGLACAVALVLVAVLFVMRNAPTDASSPSSIAVMPFQNLSPDPENAYIASGLHAELIIELRKLDGLRVIARPSTLTIAEQGIPIVEVAKVLDVDTVLEGTVQVSGNEIGVSAHLVDAATGDPLWVRSYLEESANILSIHQAIAQDVAASMNRESAEPETELKAENQVEPEVYWRYFQARHLNSRGQFHEAPLAAREMLEELVDQHPDFFPAQAALAFNYITDLQHLGPSEEDRRHEVVERARRIITNAARRWPDHPGVHASQAWFARYDGNLQLAAQHYEQALLTDPGNTEVLTGALYFAQELNRPLIAIEIGEYLVDRDILCVSCYEPLAQSYLARGRFSDVENVYERMGELGLDSPVVRGLYGIALLEQNRPQEALAKFQSIESDHPTLVAARIYLSALAHFRMGDLERYQSMRADLERMNQPAQLASLLVQVGDLDATCEILMAQDDLWAGTFDHKLSVMRSHKCWDDLAGKAGIWPEDPREHVPFTVDLPDAARPTR